MCAGILLKPIASLLLLAIRLRSTSRHRDDAHGGGLLVRSRVAAASWRM
jgi:hypothetical protein